MYCTDHILRLDLHPIAISTVQDVFRVWMLHNQTFPALLHDVVHALADILSRLAFPLCGKFNTPLDLRDTGTEVPLAELQ